MGLFVLWQVESSGPEIKPMSPALAGRFLTMGPPGTSPRLPLIEAGWLTHSSSPPASDLSWGPRADEVGPGFRTLSFSGQWQDWRRLLRVPWTARRSNQSTLKEINPEYSLKDWGWSSNTLATWWEELTHWKRLWCWERLRVGGEGGDWGWDGWMASPTQWTWVWANSGR